MDVPRIVQATGIAVSCHDPKRKKLVETAMLAAVEKAVADGITDPGEVRALMLAARDQA